MVAFGLPNGILIGTQNEAKLIEPDLRLVISVKT